MNYQASFYPWITQNVPVQVITNNINILLRKVEEELLKQTGETASITLTAAPNVPSQINAIVKGDVQIAFMNPLGFVFANQLEPQVKALSVVERLINNVWGVTYFSQLYTHKKTAITPDNFKSKLKNRAIAFGLPISTSNFIIPAYELKQINLNIYSTFNKIEFLGGHDIVARAVYNGQTDIGAGHDGVIIDLSNQYGCGDALSALVTLFKSSPIPSDPVAVNIADQTAYQNLQTAFENASKTPEGLGAIKIFWGSGRYLLPADSASYAYLLTAVEELGLRQSDLIST
jgi:ABC-type phosphate/phosphonate transport system substrate-binding protein